jgi:hypothetical protein
LAQNIGLKGKLSVCPLVEFQGISDISPINSGLPWSVVTWIADLHRDAAGVPFINAALIVQPAVYPRRQGFAWCGISSAR